MPPLSDGLPPQPPSNGGWVGQGAPVGFPLSGPSVKRQSRGPAMQAALVCLQAPAMGAAEDGPFVLAEIVVLPGQPWSYRSR